MPEKKTLTLKVQFRVVSTHQVNILDHLIEIFPKLLDYEMLLI